MAGRAIAEPRVSNLVLVGLFVAALQTLHPVFAPLVALWAASYAAVLLGAWLWRERRISVQSLGRAVLALAAVGVLMVGLSPVATVFNIRFYDWVRSNFYTQGLPVYDLPLRVMPSWVFQTREFYFLPVHVSSLQDVVTAYIAPLGLLALAVLALFRYRRSWLIWALVPSMVAFGVYGSTRNCSYCVQRNLLSLGPVAAVMTPVGIAALASYRRRVLNWGAAVAAIAVVVLVGHQATVEARRVIDGGYMAPNEFRTVASQLAGKRGPIYLEAIGQGRSAPAAMEMPSLYDITNEATRQRLAISNETNDYGGLTYLVGVRPPQVKTGPEWVPNYRWVITRVPSIATDRRLVFSRGPFALEERRSPLDVAITSGIAVDNADRDPRGLAWVQGPMTFWVSALERTRVWLVLDFEGNTPARLVQPRGSTTLERTPTHLRVCVPVVSPAPNPLRSTVTLAFRQAPEQPAGTAFGMPSPSKAVRLAGMHATATNCARGR
jgi:hypothetical protein